MVSLYALLTPAQHVQTVKDAARHQNLLHEFLKVRKPDSATEEANGKLVIPLAKEVEDDTSDAQREDEASIRHEILCQLSDKLSDDILQEIKVIAIEQENDLRTPSTNHLASAFSQAYNKLPPDSPIRSHFPAAQLLASLPKSYNIYPPLLLLPRAFHTTPVLSSFLTALSAAPTLKTSFLSRVALATHTTHIAISAPIPSHTPSSTPNTLRRPLHLHPLHGDFGPPSPASDFASGLWVSCRQNGVLQTWAPRHTMFSAGNVTEKARLLRLGPVRDAVEGGRERGEGCAAVDLFAGIGYFAFSYVKAGVGLVLAWDLNPWSVEGLRRGAVANGWGVEVVQAGRSVEMEELGGAVRLLAFCESNEKAHARIERLRGDIPPIRHVNCGMLPSAEIAWETAVRALDPRLGGWVHLHESVKEDSIQAKSQEVLVALDGVFTKTKVEKEISEHGDIQRDRETQRHVVLEHIEAVKSIGPRFWHIVLDFWIPPSS